MFWKSFLKIRKLKKIGQKLQFFFTYWFAANTFNENKENCPFCQESVINLQSVHRSQKIIAFYALTPTEKGNLLIVPERHVTRFELLNNEEIIEIRNLIQDSAKAFKQLWNIEDYLIIQKNGFGAGQSEAHIHFHIIPCRQHPMKILYRAFHRREEIDTIEMTKRVKELRHYFKNKKKVFNDNTISKLEIS